jgi:hypothetical protein
MKVFILIAIVFGVLYFAKEGISTGASFSSQSYEHEQAIRKGSDSEQ